ncbi:MAG TPA: response regulator, partial [Polyangiaceae bacterium]|nr:response regulator [Polyangiaceae bacterium]
CKTVHSAGQDLLALINQVLDLAKIEAGRQDLDVSSAPLKHFAEHAQRVFEPLAAQKGLRLTIEIQPGLPESISTDVRRVERILTNLLGNAVKFTEQGEVKFSIGRPAPGVRLQSKGPLEQTLAFAVSDTGIGIPVEAQERVFAPFEQLESRTDRRYTGTGLGLSIARESALLLGGELTVESHEGQGSTFTCYLPERSAGEPQKKSDRAVAAPFQPIRVSDDRATLEPRDAPLLVIEDDSVLAEQLVDIIHSRKLKALVAGTAAEGLTLARQRKPCGIILDVKLPDLDGWTVMERLRQDPLTSAIPVHFVSGVDAPDRGLALGAIGYLTKPATHRDLAAVVRGLSQRSSGATKRILVVEDSAAQGESILLLLKKENLEAEHVGSAGAALSALENKRFGCMILDLGLPDMDGLGLLEVLRTRPDIEAPHVVVHTGRALTKKEMHLLEAYAEAVIVKDGSSAERLLEEIRLFVRHLKETLPPSPSSRPEPRPFEVSLKGSKILVAEDDMRTVYALSALLRGKGADVLTADTGREALDMLAKHPDVDCVLMDVMMPEMDGYEAMRSLRKDVRFSQLPVIALTAKAMKGERERCLEAGASDYLSKPVDSQQLLATVRTWLKPEMSDVLERN